MTTATVEAPGAECAAAATLPRPAIEGAVHLPLALLRASITNPRKSFDQAALQDLAASITTHGLLQPILARPISGAQRGGALYEIVAGERRWRACQLAGQPSIMAIVREMTDFEVLEVQLIENLKRTDLTELEEADGYAQLLRRHDGLQGYANADELAARIGKSRSYVFQRLKLRDLTEPGRQALAAGHIGFSIALLIARLAKPEDQARATTEIVRGWAGEPFTYKQAEDYIHRHFHLDLDRAAFKITDATLVPQAGSCRECPKRSGANPDLFQDVKKADTCTDPECYHAKEQAHRQRLKDEAVAKGMPVIEGNAAKKAKPKPHASMKGYLALDEVHPELGSNKPLRKLLGKKLPEVLLFENPATKALVEVVREAEALALLKEAGVLKTAQLPGSVATQRDAERKARAETEWRTLVARLCVEAALGNAGADAAFRAELLQHVAIVLWGRLSSDDEKRVERLLGWEHIGSEYAAKGNEQRKTERIRALQDGQLTQYFVACAIAAQLHASTSPYSGGKQPERLLAIAQRLGVDVAAVRQAQRLEQGQTRRVAAARKMPAPAPTPANAHAAVTPKTALAAALKKAAAKPPASKAAAVRYRCQASGSTWSGRGLKPRWLQVALDQGRTLAEFEVAHSLAHSVAPPAPRPHISAAAANPFRPE